MFYFESMIAKTTVLCCPKPWDCHSRITE